MMVQRLLVALLIGSSKAMRNFGLGSADLEAASSSSEVAQLRYDSGHDRGSSWNPTNSNVRKPERPLLRASDAASLSSNQEIALLEDGTLEWGPYRVDPNLFQLEYYPYDHPALAHLYAPDGSEPSTFPARMAPKLLNSMPTLYRPDPELLHAIQRSIFGRLNDKRIYAQQVHPDAKLFYEGMFLWPPLQQTETGLLQMPSKYLVDTLHRAPGRRLSPDMPSKPNLYLFTVIPPKAKPEKEEIRHIMAMSTARPEKWVNLYGKDQTLWLLYEARSKKTDPNKKVELKSFVGATFLRRETEDILQEVGDWERVAR